MLPELVATVSAGLFAGAAVFVSLVEHPARIECGTVVAVTQFRPSYRRAALMQAPLAVVGSFAGIIATLAGSGVLWLIGGVLIGSVIPLTLIVIAPTNRRLLDPLLEKDSSDAATLLSRWGQVHAMRSLLGFTAFAMFVGLLG